MIPDHTVDRYYYIFDSRQGRALVMDRMTGEEYARAESPRAQLIDHVWRRRSASAPRAFAQWCARQTGVERAPLYTVPGRLWAAVRRESDPANVSRVRADTTDAAVLATAVGLPRERADAAQLLVARACTHASAPQAALDAAHMHERWVEFTAEATPENAVRGVRRRHVDWLLDALPSA